MKHLKPQTLQQPLMAQGGIGPVLKSIITGLLFGINPIFLLLFSGKIGRNGGSQ